MKWLFEDQEKKAQKLFTVPFKCKHWPYCGILLFCKGPAIILGDLHLWHGKVKDCKTQLRGTGCTEIAWILRFRPYFWFLQNHPQLYNFTGSPCSMPREEKCAVSTNGDDDLFDFSLGLEFPKSFYLPSCFALAGGGNQNNPRTKQKAPLFPYHFQSMEAGDTGYWQGILWFDAPPFWTSSSDWSPADHRQEAVLH